MSMFAYRAVRQFSRQGGTAKLALTYLALDIWDGDGGIARTSRADLTRSIGRDERHIRRLLTQLRRDGELVIMPRPGRSNVYAIPLYPGELGYQPPTPCTATDHACNGNHSPAFVDRESLEKGEMDHRRERDIALNGANPHGNVPDYARPARTPKREQHPQPQQQPAEPAAGPAADTWQPPDADAEPFDLPDYTDAERQAILAAERFADVPPAKRRRNTGARSGLGRWPPRTP